MEKVSLRCCQWPEHCEISSREISALSRAVGLWDGLHKSFPCVDRNLSQTQYRVGPLLPEKEGRDNQFTLDYKYSGNKLFFQIDSDSPQHPDESSGSQKWVLLEVSVNQPGLLLHI